MATKQATRGKSSPSEAPSKKDALVTTNKQTALATAEVSDEMLLGDSGSGSEGIGRQDMSIPIISLLQSLSPQLQKADGAYIKGAEAGDFYDNVTQSVFAKGEEGILFIPVLYRRANVEWIPKNQGGGFIADHGPDDSILAKCRRNEDTGAMLLPNGHEIVTTAQYFCFVLDMDQKKPVQQAVINLAKTQLKKARKLNTFLTSYQVPNPKKPGALFNPATFYSTFHATSVPESNDKGSWMGWQITRHKNTLDLKNGMELYLAARQFKAVVEQGAVKVANPVDEGGSGETDTEKF